MEKNKEKEKQQNPDFVDWYHRYESLDSGLQAALRKVTEPEDLRDNVALYRLFYEALPNENRRRVAFLLPWCKQCRSGTEGITKTFGATLAAEHVNENRVLQMARSKEPLDIIQLRRMAMQVKPVVDWAQFGWILLKWGKEEKRRIVEDYFYKTTYAKKGA